MNKEISEITRFKSHCVQMAEKLGELPSGSLTEDVLAYTAKLHWLEYIGNLDAAMAEIKEEEYKYFG